MINSKQPNTHTRTCGEQRKNPSCICMHWYTYRRTLSLSAAFTTAILWPPPPPSRTAPQSYIHSFIHRSVFFSSSRSRCHAPLLLFCLLSVCLLVCFLPLLFGCFLFSSYFSSCERSFTLAHGTHHHLFCKKIGIKSQQQSEMSEWERMCVCVRVWV